MFRNAKPQFNRYDPELQPKETAFEDELCARLDREAEVEGMGETDRYIFSLRLQGYSDAEIASSLGVKKQAIHKRRKQIQRELRK